MPERIAIWKAACLLAWLLASAYIGSLGYRKILYEESRSAVEAFESKGADNASVGVVGSAADGVFSFTAYDEAGQSVVITFDSSEELEAFQLHERLRVTREECPARLRDFYPQSGFGLIAIGMSVFGSVASILARATTRRVPWAELQAEGLPALAGVLGLPLLLVTFLAPNIIAFRFDVPPSELSVAIVCFLGGWDPVRLVRFIDSLTSKTMRLSKDGQK